MNTEKYSVSGLMKQTHEISRFENLFFKQVGSAYYNQDWGLDWEFFLNTPYEIPLESFVSYMTQESARRGIIITDVNAEIRNFTLQMAVEIEGLKFSLERGFE